MQRPRIEARKPNLQDVVMTRQNGTTYSSQRANRKQTETTLQTNMACSIDIRAWGQKLSPTYRKRAIDNEAVPHSNLEYLPPGIVCRLTSWKLVRADAKLPSEICRSVLTVFPD